MICTMSPTTSSQNSNDHVPIPPPRCSSYLRIARLRVEPHQPDGAEIQALFETSLQELTGA